MIIGNNQKFLVRPADDNAGAGTFALLGKGSPEASDLHLTFIRDRHNGGHTHLRDLSYRQPGYRRCRRRRYGRRFRCLGKPLFRYLLLLHLHRIFIVVLHHDTAS